MHKQSFLKAFINAFEGLFIFFAKERNGQIQLFIAVIIIVSGVLFHINQLEWVAIILCIALVISMEMINSAMEKLSDMVEPNFHPVIKTIKDISAAAVLWAAMASLVIGAVIFLPKIMYMFTSMD
jgi:diacylglycerol kinase